jgi:hypothetical protein
LSGTIGDKELTTVFQLDVSSGEITQLFSGMTSDIEQTIWDPILQSTVVGISHPAKPAYFYSAETSQTAALHKSLVDVFGGQKVVISSQSKDGTMVLVR